MSRDPLDASRRALIADADRVVVQLTEQSAARWLAEAGFDPAALAAHLEATIAALRAQDLDAQIGVPLARNAARPSGPLLERTAAWVKAVRAWLPHVNDRHVVDVLRRALRRDVRHTPNALAMLRATLPLMLLHAGALLPPVPCATLIASGEELEQGLAGVYGVADAATEARKRVTRRAADATAVLREELRKIRRIWRAAAQLSEGALGPLALSLARADVNHRSKRARREAPEAVSDDAVTVDAGATDEPPYAR